jgi:hypothetical protein
VYDLPDALWLTARVPPPKLTALATADAGIAIRRASAKVHIQTTLELCLLSSYAWYLWDKCMQAIDHHTKNLEATLNACKCKFWH